ncbi:MAG: hypothetical protein HRF51_04675 [bacterium]|jgi:hypothetical protein
MNRISILVFAAILLATGAASDDLIAELGLTIPTPALNLDDSLSPAQILALGGLTADYWLLPGDIIPTVSYSAKLKLTFYISDSGDVDSLRFLPSTHEAVLGYFRKSLHALKFRPAAIDGKSVSYQLPAELFLASEQFLDISSRRRPAAVLAFPVIDRMGVVRGDLLENSLALNGIEMPRVNSFPPYFCFFKIGARSLKYPFAVYKVSLDSSGQLLDFSEFCASRPECADNFGRAILHADFVPCRINGKNRPSEFYLTVRFFDQILYPTRKWYYDSNMSDRSIYDYCRLQSNLSVDSLINPPYPAGTSSGIVTYNSPFRVFDTLRAFVKIDTLGRIVGATFGAPEYADVVSLGKKILKNLEFIPARDLLDRKVDFRGELFLRFDGSNISRIRFEWLPHRAQPDFY